MKALPYLTFVGTLLVIILLAVWQHEETQSVSAQKDQQIQQVNTALVSAQNHAQANAVRLKKLNVTAAQLPSPAPSGQVLSKEQSALQEHHHSVAPTGGSPAPGAEADQVPAAITEAAATLKAAQAENEKITQTPVTAAAPAAPTSTPSRFIVLCCLTLFGCGLSTFFLVAKRFGPAEKQIASATLGTILGYWFSGAS